MKPASSRPRRIAWTMPSIIPDGAIISAPARAWLTACCDRSGSVASLSTSIRPPDSASGPQWPWSVYSQKHRSVITSRSGAAFLAMPMACWTIPSSWKRGGPARVLVLGDAEEDDRRDAQLGGLGDRLAQPVERELILARHRGDLATEIPAVVDEQRVDQVVHGQPVLAQHRRGAGDGPGAAGGDARDSRRRAGMSLGVVRVGWVKPTGFQGCHSGGCTHLPL